MKKGFSGSDLTAESTAKNGGSGTEEAFMNIWKKSGRNRKDLSEESNHRSEGGSLDISGVIFGDQVEKKKVRKKKPKEQLDSYRTQLLQAK